MLICFVFFFFKQKTAYEMRISDWSSDVCSSDLAKAQDYAKLAGFRGVELVSISEGSFGGGPQPPMPYARGLMAAEAKATPVEPGQVANTLTLNFQYRLARSFPRGVGAKRPLFPFVSSEVATP